jgi:hypothetical protein
MHMHSRLLLAATTLAALTSAQTIVVPQQGVGVEGPSSTAYPWNPCQNASCCKRSQ